jgi:catechol 2,3-dioxygenase-like lactoylglutathione lyase family enzyme
LNSGATLSFTLSFTLIEWKCSRSIRRMKRVRGIGGIFFKSENPEALRAWYARHLGIVSEGDAGTMFPWNQPDSPAKDNCTAWCIFPATTTYFGESKAAAMVNYVVDDLRATLKALRDEGVWVDPKVEEYDYGRFGWIMDPDGNRIELWEPLPKK